MKNGHTFHIPVMGTGFSIDSPLKVAKYGISSVISLVDDTLIEEMRKYYAAQYNEPYEPITKYDDDHRARRITAYLNLLDRLVKRQFAEIKQMAFNGKNELTKYFELLPDTSPLKQLYCRMLNTSAPSEKFARQQQLRDSMEIGKINVNIMTKLDRPNVDPRTRQPLSPEYSDALAALRGYAKSTLDSAIVFSAGINQRLYAYIEHFEDFYADAQGYIKKKIILKVSDYRSSLIQGKFLAKKGLWVSEYRIESGLNCGGHAFATNGYLMGPILEEFKAKREELKLILHKLFNTALTVKERPTFADPLPLEITAQGGIGTAQEDRFLRTHYALDATGWGTPFLLCPEATNVDEPTLKRLAEAKEGDLYLSPVSPLGVPFNNLRESRSDIKKMDRTTSGRPGSACPKGHLISNTEFTEQPICTASRLYQKLKIEKLQQEGLEEPTLQASIAAVTSKACICHDLGEGVLEKLQIPARSDRFPAVCPGPNLAYFSQIVSLSEIVGHVYGRLSILNASYRPHMFIKELRLYINYLVSEVKSCAHITLKQIKYFAEFRSNLADGIEYYQDLFPTMLADSQEYCSKTLCELSTLRDQLKALVAKHAEAFDVQPATVTTIS